MTDKEKELIEQELNHCNPSQIKELRETLSFWNEAHDSITTPRDDLKILCSRFCPVEIGAYQICYEIINLDVLKEKKMLIDITPDTFLDNLRMNGINVDTLQKEKLWINGMDEIHVDFADIKHILHEVTIREQQFESIKDAYIKSNRSYGEIMAFLNS